MKTLLLIFALCLSAQASDSLVVVKCDTIVRPHWECRAVKTLINQPVGYTKPTPNERSTGECNCIDSIYIPAKAGTNKWHAVKRNGEIVLLRKIVPPVDTIPYRWLRITEDTAGGYLWLAPPSRTVLSDALLPLPPEPDTLEVLSLLPESLLVYRWKELVKDRTSGIVHVGRTLRQNEFDPIIVEEVADTTFAVQSWEETGSRDTTRIRMRLGNHRLWTRCTIDTIVRIDTIRYWLIFPEGRLGKLAIRKDRIDAKDND